MKTLNEVIRDMYPWISEEDARRIESEANMRQQQFIYNEAQRLKPN